MDTEWFENGEFWDVFAPVMFDEARWAEAPAIADFILSFKRLPRGAHALDMCCGPGRVAVELAIRGFRVTGVDITETYLEAAREWAGENGVSADFVRGDARSWNQPGEYDLALCTYTSLGYFKTPEEDLQVLSNLYQSLKPGGSVIIELQGKEIAVRDFIMGERFERSGGMVTTEFKPVNDWEGLSSRWIYEKDGNRSEHEFTQRLYSATELKQMLSRAGFTKTVCYGGFRDIPYDQDADTLVTLSVKPK